MRISCILLFTLCLGLASIFAPQSIHAQTLDSRTLPIEWTSSYWIPWPFGAQKLSGEAGAARLKAICEDKSESSQKMIAELIKEYLDAADAYCEQLNRTYTETDIFGQQCLITETFLPYLPEGVPDSETGEVDCEKLANYISDTFSRATMDRDLVRLFLKAGVSPCLKFIYAECTGGSSSSYQLQQTVSAGFN